MTTTVEQENRALKLRVHDLEEFVEQQHNYIEVLEEQIGEREHIARGSYMMFRYKIVKYEESYDPVSEIGYLHAVHEHLDGTESDVTWMAKGPLGIGQVGLVLIVPRTSSDN